MSWSTILMCLVFLLVAAALEIDLNKFKRMHIPPGSWQGIKSYPSVKTLVSCAARAVHMDAQYYKLDYTTKVCEVGTVDQGSLSGEATMSVMGREVVAGNLLGNKCHKCHKKNNMFCFVLLPMPQRAPAVYSFGLCALTRNIKKHIYLKQRLVYEQCWGADRATALWLEPQHYKIWWNTTATTARSGERRVGKGGCGKGA